jgi:GWxTD domain-containing protein
MFRAWSGALGGILPVVAALLMLPGAPLADSREIDVVSAPVYFDRPEFDSLVLVEFPFSLARHQFEFYQPDSASGMCFARIYALLTIYGTDGLPVDSASTYFSAAAVDHIEAARPGIRLFNSVAVVLREGIYSGRLKVIDVVSKAQGEMFFDRIAVELPEKNRLAIGGECLAHKVAFVGADSDTTGADLRNGYEVYCNSTGLFSTDDSLIYVYAEVYNLIYDPDSVSDFEATWSVQSGGGAWRGLDKVSVPKPGRSAVLSRRFDIADWPAGSYRLRLTLEDESTRKMIGREWPFRIMAPQPAHAAEDMIDDPGDTLSVELQLRLARYLLNPEEKEAVDRLSEVGRKSFLTQFWQDRDTDPTTRINEFRLEMLDRYLFANSYFSVDVGADDGWYTDRGRILMTYGTWDSRVDRVSTTGDYPYEVWNYYQIEDGAIFIFVDEAGINEYRLVHSNVRGELWNADWNEYLLTGGLDRH